MVKRSVVSYLYNLCVVISTTVLKAPYNIVILGNMCTELDCEFPINEEGDIFDFIHFSECELKHKAPKISTL